MSDRFSLAFILLACFRYSFEMVKGERMLINDYLFKGDVPLINGALDAYALRQRTIAKNIANIDTPQYRPEAVKFEEYFHDEQEVLSGQQTDSGHIPLGAPTSIEGTVQPGAVPKPDVFFTGENHVNIDDQMSQMAQNQIRFRFSAQMLSRFFKGVNSAITGNNPSA